MIPSLIILLIFFCLLLIKSADFVIIALRRLNKLTSTGTFVLSAFILAVGTSLPELFVGITSALENTSNLSFGNILGANIANISLVAGISALIAGKVNIRGEMVKKETGIAIFAGFLPLILVMDGNLGRADGLILLASFGAYSTSLFKKRFEEIAGEFQEEGFFYRFLRKFTHVNSNLQKELARLFIGLALLLFSADTIVKISLEIAKFANLPVFLVGLVLISIGTTLPEVAFSIRSVEDGEPSMFIGNLLGSIIANSTLILGIVSLINPIRVGNLNDYNFAVFSFVVILGLFLYFIRSKNRLDRWEAVFLVGIYLLFVFKEFMGI